MPKTTTPTPEMTSEELDRREADLDARLPKLRERRQALALDAVGDGSRREELEAADADVARAERDLQLVAAARRELARRRLAAEIDAESERRRGVVEELHALDEDRVAAAKRIDDAAAELAGAITAHRDLAFEQDRLLRLEGWRQIAENLETGVLYKLRAGVRRALHEHGLLRLDLLHDDLATPHYAEPFAETDRTSAWAGLTLEVALADVAESVGAATPAAPDEEAA